MDQGRDVSSTWSLVPDRPAAVGPRAYVLAIGRHECRAFELPLVGELTIGRDDNADIVVADLAVSRYHARLIGAAGEIRIADLGSHNGTMVNGVPVDGSRVLASGDEIAIGELMLVVHLQRRPPVHATATRATPIQLGDREVIVADPAMVRIYELLARLGKAELAVLVCGETGAGKENAAYAVHFHSPRRTRPFVSINCAAIPESLAESELFGHEKGAFSGATTAKAGLLEAAAGGTVFLDEVGELPLAVQAKLLRALDARRVTRVGGLHEVELDVRIVAATNRDLDAEVRAGRFRRDLLYRINVATVLVPPLRERPGELSLLARAFLDDACSRAGRARLAISAAAMRVLAAHAWPGNVRELRNAMHLLAATADGDIIEPADLPSNLQRASPAHDDNDDDAPPTEFRPVGDEVEELEALRMAEALDATGGVHVRAAALIGMPLRTFTTKFKRFGLSARRIRH